MRERHRRHDFDQEMKDIWKFTVILHLRWTKEKWETVQGTNWISTEQLKTLSFIR